MEMEDNMPRMRAQTEFSDDSVSSIFLQIGTRHGLCRTSSECQLLEHQAKPVLLVVKLVICPNEILSILSFVLMGSLALQSAYKAFKMGVHVLGVVTSLTCGGVSTPTSEVICCNIGKRTQW